MTNFVLLSNSSPIKNFFRVEKFSCFVPKAAILCLCVNFIQPAHGGDDKFKNLDSTSIIKIVSDDIEKNQALVTADFTRAIYDERCKFQDEISTYEINEYIKGTKALFNKDLSYVKLESPVELNENVLHFKFSELLAFNIPFNPKVKLEGELDLTRGDDGLIIKSREHWKSLSF